METQIYYVNLQTIDKYDLISPNNTSDIKNIQANHDLGWMAFISQHAHNSP